MGDDRIERMREMVARFPDEPRGRYFLAHELFRSESWSEAAENYQSYLRLTPGDEGAGWRNYGVCLQRLERGDEAREAFRKGIECALAHHHEGLAAELRELLDELE